MMTPDARAAHERFAAKLRAATEHLDRATRDLTAAAVVSYESALLAPDADHDHAWRTFVALVAALATELEHAAAPHAPAIVAELRSLVRENADLLDLATSDAIG